jgi:hypothetical protein
MAETHTGRCYCGAVEIEVTGAPLRHSVDLSRTLFTAAVRLSTYRGRLSTRHKI